MHVIKGWISKEITSHLGFEDEILINLISGELQKENPDPFSLSQLLEEFLVEYTEPFMKNLWKLLAESQDSPIGISPVLLKQKEAEIHQSNADHDAIEAKLKQIRRSLQK